MKALGLQKTISYLNEYVPIFSGGNHEEKSNICSNSSEGRVGENEIDLACFEPWNMAIKLHQSDVMMTQNLIWHFKLGGQGGKEIIVPPTPSPRF